MPGTETGQIHPPQVYLSFFKVVLVCFTLSLLTCSIRDVCLFIRGGVKGLFIFLRGTCLQCGQNPMSNLASHPVLSLSLAPITNGIIVIKSIYEYHFLQSYFHVGIDS